MALSHVAAEARALVHSENAIDATDDTADHATDDGADRPRRALAIARTTLDATGHSLRGRHYGHGHDGPDYGNQKTTTYLHFHFRCVLRTAVISRAEQVGSCRLPNYPGDVIRSTDVREG
jgi:hypothetical protein